MEKTLEFIKDKFEDELKVLKKKGNFNRESTINTGASSDVPY